MAVKSFRWTSCGIALIITLLGIAGCERSNLRKTPQTNPCDDSAHIAQLKKTEQLLSQLQNRLSACRIEAESFKAQIQKSQIELLEKGAQIKQLEARITSQQQTIDEAVLEVVRTKAKLRSIESRAEAASTLAETEIALKAMKKHNFSETGSRSDLFDKVESLLRMSADEFKRENYGGALYLAGQARAQIRAIQNSRDLEPGAEMMAGEVVFSPPLPLILLKRSNLRKSPDIHSDVLRVLGKDLAVIGYSHKDEWIRVRMGDGESGWIHQSLIQGR